MDNFVDMYGLVFFLWVYVWMSSVWERGVMWVVELIDIIGFNLENGYELVYWLFKWKLKK